MKSTEQAKQYLSMRTIVGIAKRWLRVIGTGTLMLLLLPNQSGQLATENIPAQTSSSLTFNPEADTYVKQANPSTNYGTASSLQVNGGSNPGIETYIRFTTSGISGTVDSARLRLYATTNGTNNGPAIYASNSAWTETGMTWKNRPGPIGNPVDNKTKINTSSWVEYDVSSLVTGSGTFSFVLVADSSDGVRFSSRQSSRSPQLVVTFHSIETTPVTTDTPVSTDTPVPTSTDTPTETPAPTFTETPTDTATQEATFTPTFTQPPDETSTSSIETDTPTPAPTDTSTPTATSTDTSTPTPTDTSTPTPTDTSTPTPTPPASGSVVFVGAGDISTCGNNNDEATAKLLDAIPGTVYALGDNAYTDGSSTQYANCYDPTWGRHKSRTKPVPGNHEYLTSGAAGYFQYFNNPPSYYAFNLGSWRIYALNSEISVTATSAEVTWLQNDLAANPSQCVLAYWHKPRWSSGSTHGSNSSMQTLWQILYNAGAEVIVNGHEHNYERFAEMNASGAAVSQGLREFVVGTGGNTLYPFGSALPASQLRNNSTYGVLKLTLRSGGYDWQFVPVAGSSFTDGGSGTCH